MSRHDFLAAPQGRFGTPVESYPTPNVEDVIIVEDVPLDSSGYSAIEPGTPRSAKDPDAKLVYQQIIAGNESKKFVRRIYATTRVNQDVYNYALKYSGESKDHPIFIRSYIEARSDYQPATRGSVLQALYRITVVNAGSGYVAAPAISFTGGGGSGAQAKAILNTSDGSISWIVLTRGGTGYTSAPTVVIARAPGEDTTGVINATATALVQTCGLVSEETQKLDVEDPQLNSLFWRVIRTYETLPGPLLPGKKKSKPRRTPEKYIVSESTVVSVQKVSSGTDATAPENEGDTSTVEPIDSVASQKRDEAVTLVTQGTIEYRKNEADQLVTINSSVGATGSAPTIDATTESAQVNALGDGTFETVTATVPEVFDAKVISDSTGIEFPKLRNRTFLANEKEETISVTSAGTTATPDALATSGIGIISSDAQRISLLKVRKKNTTKSGTNTALTGYDFDERTGLLIPITEQVVAAGSAGTALQSDGTYAEVQPHNPVWSIKTTRKATMLDSTGRTYVVSRHVSLDRVLVVFEPVIFTDSDGDIRFFDYRAEMKDYSGAYDITVFEAWKNTPHTISGITNFRPTSFNWTTPYGRGSVAQCLHGPISISGSTGSSDPTWGYLTWSYFYAATTPATMPRTVVLLDHQEPYRGGWLRHKETITVT